MSCSPTAEILRVELTDAVLNGLWDLMALADDVGAAAQDIVQVLGRACDELGRLQGDAAREVIGEEE